MKHESKIAVAAKTMLAIALVVCLAMVTIFALDRQAAETLCRLPDADAGLCRDVEDETRRFFSPKQQSPQPARHNWQTAGYLND